MNRTNIHLYLTMFSDDANIISASFFVFKMIEIFKNILMASLQEKEEFVFCC